MKTTGKRGLDVEVEGNGNARIFFKFLLKPDYSGKQIVYPISKKCKTAFLVGALVITFIRRNAKLDKCSKKGGIRRQEGNKGRIVYGIALSSI